MRKLIDNDYLTLVVRLALGGVFIYASIYKILDPPQFAKSIWYYHILPGSVINISALIMSWLELLCGVAIIAGAYYRGAILWVNILLLVFMVAVASAVNRGISIDCGCFKAASASRESAIYTIYRDVAFLAMGIQLWFSRSRRWMLANLT